MEAYRSALERKDLNGVAATHVELGADQRTGFERYFESADGLAVTLSDVDVLVDGEEALVRLSSVVVQKDGQWRMRGVKRS